MSEALAAYLAEVEKHVAALNVRWLRQELLKTLDRSSTSSWVLSGVITDMQCAWIAEECEAGLAGAYVHNSLLGPGALPDQLETEDRWLGFGEPADEWGARMRRKSDDAYNERDALIRKAIES